MIDFLRNLPFKTYIGLFLCSLFFSYWLVPKVVWLARGLGIFTKPISPKSHPVPSLGGLAIGIPFIAGISLLLLLRNQVSENIYMIPLQMRGLFFGSCLILAFGLLQDLLEMKWPIRYTLQISVAAIAYYYGFHLEPLSVSNADTLFPVLLSFSLTVLWIIGLTNLFTLLNRLTDVLTPFMLLITFSLMFVAFFLDQYRTIVVCCLLSGSLLGMLSHGSTRLNLGGTGTFFLGFVLAVSTLQSHMQGATSLLLSVLFLTFAFPVLDILLVIIKNVRSSEKTFEFGKSFLYRQLIASGLSRTSTSRSILLSSFLFGLSTVLLILGDSPGLPLIVLGLSMLVLSFGIKILNLTVDLPGQTPDLRLRVKSLHHFKQAIALQMQIAIDPEENWRLLCQAAQEFTYRRLSHQSNSGEVIREWHSSSGEEDYQKHEIDMKRSGGKLIIEVPASGIDRIDEERESLFRDLATLFDRTLENRVISHLKQRRNKLRVLLVNRYFSGMSATGQMLEDLAEDLVKADVAVTILTGSLGYENPSPLPGRNEFRKGVHIYRIPATYFGRDNHLNRTMDFVFFYIFSAVWILKSASHRYTHIMTFTDPPLIGIVGYLAKRLKGWKYIYNIQDLYPETALALGILKRKGGIFRLCNRINRGLLGQADAIVAIGQNMADHLQRVGKPLGRIEVISNWADGQKIRPIDVSENDLRAKLNLKDVYTVIYTGNMGLAQEIDVLVQMIKAFKNCHTIQFLFIGGGIRRTDLETAVSDHYLKNVIFVNYQPRDNLSHFLGLGDIGIVSLSPQMEGLALPTKTYSYLAAGLPVLAISSRKSELKTLQDNGLGVHFAPDSIEEIIKFLKAKAKRKHRKRTHHIRSYFETHLDRPHQTQKYLSLLQSLH